MSLSEPEENTIARVYLIRLRLFSPVNAVSYIRQHRNVKHARTTCSWFGSWIRIDTEATHLNMLGKCKINTMNKMFDLRPFQSISLLQQPTKGWNEQCNTPLPTNTNSC